jgi:hypothetical protein
MPTYDLAGLTNAFVGGGTVFQKEVLAWDVRSLGYQVRTNVNTPQAMAKFSVDGEPRPYRKDDDFNGATITDRVLIAYQSKYDQELDAEDLRNEYLADLPEMPFEQYAVQQAARQYLAKLLTDTVYFGVRDAGGDAAVDICDGFGTIIAAAIVAGDLVPVATGAITVLNAVEKVELVADAVPVVMKKMGFTVKCSYTTLEKYRKNYRTLYGFNFNKNEKGEYKLDGINATLQPDETMGESSRLIATIANNMIIGTDTERLAMYPTPHLNVLQNRIMFPLGCQIRDFEMMVVNDQA